MASRPAGNAIADLTGPFGEASGAASDFAGVFEGIGDIAEDVAGKVGLNAAAMSSAIGGIGVAVAVAAAGWTFFKGKQEEARRKQEELIKKQREFNDALREGRLREAAEEFQDIYGGALAAADELGASTRQVTEYITGQSDALAPLIDKHNSLATVAGDAADKIEGARKKYLDANGAIAEQDAALGELESILGTATRATDRQTTAQEDLERQTDRNRDSMDRLRGSLSMDRAFQNFQRAMADAMTAAEGEVQTTADEILNLKDSIFDVAEYAKLTPVQVAILLGKLDQGDYAGVARDVSNYYQANKVPVHTQLMTPTGSEAEQFRRRAADAIGEIQLRAAIMSIRSGSNYFPTPY